MNLFVPFLLRQETRLIQSSTPNCRQPVIQLESQNRLFLKNSEAFLRTKHPACIKLRLTKAAFNLSFD